MDYCPLVPYMTIAEDVGAITAFRFVWPICVGLKNFGNNTLQIPCSGGTEDTGDIVGLLKMKVTTELGPTSDGMFARSLDQQVMGMFARLCKCHNGRRSIVLAPTIVHAYLYRVVVVECAFEV